jgi:magnesium-transporting ATPase (P-type)
MINERHAREAEQKGLNSIYGQIICEKPNNRINRFQGMCQFENELIPLQIVNLLLRGTKLKNTNWVVGIVVFTGRECKISMNQGYSYILKE